MGKGLCVLDRKSHLVPVVEKGDADNDPALVCVKVSLDPPSWEIKVQTFVVLAC